MSHGHRQRPNRKRLAAQRTPHLNGQLPRIAVTPLTLRTHRCLQQHLCLALKITLRFSKRRQPRLDLIQQRNCVLLRTLKRQGAIHQLIQNHTQRIHIRTRIQIGMLPTNLLGRHVLHRPKHLPRLGVHRRLTALAQPRHPKIHHTGHALQVHDDVLRLQVPVQNPAPVRVRHCIAHTCKKFQPTSQIQRTNICKPVQCITRDIFHRIVMARRKPDLRRASIHNLRNPGMFKPLQNFDLMQKPSPGRDRFKPMAKHLHRGHLTRFAVLGQKHDAHTTGSKPRAHVPHPNRRGIGPDAPPTRCIGLRTRRTQRRFFASLVPIHNARSCYSRLMPQRRQLHDRFFKQAKAEGYVARSAYKLIEIDDKFTVLRGAKSIIDLGCSPGSWLQVLDKRCHPAARIVGVDLKPTEAPLSPRVSTIVADFTRLDLSTLPASPPFDVVVSDMAPNTSGAGDDLRSASLCQSVLDACPTLLRIGGHLVMKILEGAETASILNSCRKQFAQARMFKPQSSRDMSRETFVIAQGYKGVA